jgi:hypothetical protein
VRLRTGTAFCAQDDGGFKSREGGCTDLMNAETGLLLDGVMNAETRLLDGAINAETGLDGAMIDQCPFPGEAQVPPVTVPSSSARMAASGPASSRSFTQLMLRK